MGKCLPGKHETPSLISSTPTKQNTIKKLKRHYIPSNSLTTNKQGAHVY